MPIALSLSKGVLPGFDRLSPNGRLSSEGFLVGSANCIDKLPDLVGIFQALA